MDSKKFLFVLRHGERADRAPGYRQPKSMLPHDPPLTTLGVRQAEDSALRIQRLIPRDTPIHIVSSPFYRCLMTAAALAKRFSAPIHIQEGFGEWLYTGDFTESPMDNLRSVVAPETLAKELGAPVVTTPSLARASYPESLSSLRTRVRSVYNRYLGQVREPALIIVTHMYLVNTISEIWVGHSCDFLEDYYCTMSHAEMQGGRYTMKVEGEYDHARQDVVGGPSDSIPPPATPILLPWEDYKEKAKELRIKGSITDILRDNILEIALDDRNFLIFTKSSDTDLYEFDFDEKVPLIMAVMEQDLALGKVFSRLVPRQTTELLFWKSYFYTVELVRDQTLLKFSTNRPASDLEDLKIKSDKHRELMDELESELTAEPQIVVKEKKAPREPVAITDLQRQLKAALARIEQLEKRVEVLEAQQSQGGDQKGESGEVPSSVSPLD